MPTVTEGFPDSLSQKKEHTSEAVAPPKKRWLGYFWDTANVDAKERRFLTKLDFCLLTMGCLSMFSKTIDQANFTNAYFSGMKTDLDLSGNRYNYINTAYTVGYVVGQVPSVMLLTRVPPHVWIPLQEILWTIFTFASAGAQNYSTVVAFRFLVGLIESGAWASNYYLLSNWYNKSELGKRAGILQASQSVAPVVSGFMQAAIYKNMNGYAGLAGWRWLFVIDGIISLPIAILAYFLLPDTPVQAKPNWMFSQEDLDLAQARMRKAGRAQVGKPYTKEAVLGWFKSWKTPMFIVIYCILPFNSYPQTAFSFWLQEQDYSVVQINQLPTVGNAFTFGWNLLTVWLSDGPLRGRRWPTVIFGSIIMIVIDILLVTQKLYVPLSQKMPLYVIAGMGDAVVPIAVTWMNELLTDSAEQRAFTISTMNALGSAMGAWIPVVLFPASHMPAVRTGNIVAAVFGAVTLVLYSTVAILQHREEVSNKRFLRANPDSSDDNVHEDGLREPTKEVAEFDEELAVAELKK